MLVDMLFIKYKVLYLYRITSLLPQFLYDLEQPLISKMNIIVQKIYGGEEVEVPQEIAEKIRNLESQVFS